jgi:phosphatidylglycerol lysyltransferase
VNLDRSDNTPRRTEGASKTATEIFCRVQRVRERALELLKKHGWNSTSFQILEPGFEYWFDDDGDACVGYVDTGGAWVAAGPPVAAHDRIAGVLQRFVDAAAKAGRRVSCFGTEDRFNELVGWPAIRIGEQPVWSPADWPAIIKSSKSLREQLRRARAKQVVVEELTPVQLEAGHATRSELETLIARWLASRTIAPMGFLVQVDPFTFPPERRYFVARHNGKIVGFLGVIPIYARRGWFFEDFLRDPSAPNGTIELLVDAGMRAAQTAQVELITLGLAPLAGAVSPWLRIARKLGRALYDFDGLRAFKAKLKPKSWDPIYLSHPQKQHPITATIDTLTAFSRGGLLRFGVATLLRGPTIVVQTLAALLVLWTLILALPITSRWFPTPIWQYGWVAFDVAAFVGLFVLSRRWRPRLATLLASAITADALVTLLEGLLWNVPHRRSALDFLVIAVAVAAPTFAAIVLWNARARATVAAR